MDCKELGLDWDWIFDPLRPYVSGLLIACGLGCLVVGGLVLPDKRMAARAVYLLLGTGGFGLGGFTLAGELGALLGELGAGSSGRAK